MRGVVRYLVQMKKKTKNLENTKKVVAEFERRMEKGSFRSRNLKEGVMLEL